LAQAHPSQRKTLKKQAAMAPKKGGGEQVEASTTLGPTVREGEIVFGVAHIFASFNDTFVHVTDLSGRETIIRVTGGMKVKADRDESSPYAAMLAAQDVAARCKELGIGALHIKLRATGGTRTRTPGPGAQSALRALARVALTDGDRGGQPSCGCSRWEWESRPRCGRSSCPTAPAPAGHSARPARACASWFRLSRAA